MKHLTHLLFTSFVVVTLALAGCGDDGTTTDTGMDATGDTGGGECDGAADGTVCAAGICVGGACGASECGDGYVDGDEGELCDDGNTVPGDGCEPDTCTPGCTMDEDCDDGLFCNGAETCNTVAGRCQAAPMDFCDDSDPCTADSCDEGMGCTNELIDVDGDGYSPETCTTAGLDGDDCDDTNFTVYPGADELCDSVDNDCDGTVDNDTVTITCYADDDEDTYGDPADTVDACSCPVGYIARGDDCDDTNRAVNPSITEYTTDYYCPGGGACDATTGSWDWDCSGGEDRQYTTLSWGGCGRDPSCSGFCLSCSGTGWTTTSVPGCGEPTRLPTISNYRTCSGLSTCTQGFERRRQPCR